MERIIDNNRDSGLNYIRNTVRIISVVLTLKNFNPVVNDERGFLIPKNIPSDK